VANITIRTSTPGWLSALASAYRIKTSVLLTDDAGLGVDPVSETLFEMGRRANLSYREWIAVVVALGVTALGAFVVVMAVLDLEPYSKVASTIAAGTVMALGGGFSAIRVLTGYKPPKVTVSPSGFVIEFD
jgi:hypothetical protein